METQPKGLATDFVTLQGVLSPVKPCHDHRAVSAPQCCQNWWHQPHGNLESRVEIELDGDKDSQRSGQLYLELKIFPWNSTSQFLPPIPIFVHTRGDSREVLVSRNKLIYYQKSEVFACYKNKNVQSLS